MLASMTSHHRQSIVLDSANSVSDVAVLDYDSGIVRLIFQLRGADMRLPTTCAKYVLACVLALGLGSLAWTAQEDQTKTKGGKSVTVTGCLQKGDEAGEYSIT